MKLHTRNFRLNALGLLAMTLPLAACAQSPSPAPAPAQADQAAAAPRAPAQPLVSGLPDFTHLVDQVAPGVVNIETVIERGGGRQARGPAGPSQDEIPEIFRRFFGPGFGMPGPDGGEGGPSIKGRGMGSGFIISPDGYVLTNHHVVADASEVKVRLGDRREFTAKVIGSDAQYDVALLKIDGSNLPTVRIGESRSLKPGQWVVAIGSPFGLDHSVTAGVVSATGRSTGGQDQRYVPFIQTDVAINQGNSGGPLLNTRGEVVGINSQIFSASGGYMGISFAIPVDLAMGAVEQIKKTGRVSRGQIGVLVGQITSDMVKGFNLPDSRGALVNQLVEGGAGQKAGLEVGDVIRSVNGTAINDSAELPPLIGMQAPGSKVRLGILREGKPREISVTLTELSEDAQAAANRPATAGEEAAPQAGANALLGLEVTELTAAQRRQMGLGSDEGVVISRVNGQAARDARLSNGMVILQVGRTPVSSVAALNRALGGYKKGDVVMLLVRSGTSSAFVAVKAGE